MSSITSIMVQGRADVPAIYIQFCAGDSSCLGVDKHSPKFGLSYEGDHMFDDGGVAQQGGIGEQGQEAALFVPKVKVSTNV
jgi:hypothetical protein